MSKPLLSILIPTVVGREAAFESLMSKLSAQYEGLEVEIAYLKDDKKMPIGEKREQLYKMANGVYSLQVDDDDELAPNAIELILDAIRNNPGIPCITYKEKCIINGEYKSSIFSIRYIDWQDEFDTYNFVRTPFYKSVIRTDIAQSVPFERIRLGEDHAWARAIRPWLTSEYFIDQEIYYYIHNSSPSHERYGFYHDEK